MFSFICVWINGWVNNREAGDFRRYRAHYDVIVMPLEILAKFYRINSMLISVVDGCGISDETTRRWMPLSVNDDKSVLDQVI